jgi:peptidyl-prolyl cis-trans isomerase SurA
MTKIKINFFIIAYIVFFFTNLWALENKILFKVDNKIITSIDIYNELKYLEIINKEFKDTSQKKAFEIAKRSLIREKIKEIELSKVFKELKVESEFLDKMIINYFKSFEINNISDFEIYFASREINPDSIKKKISLEILWNQFIYSKFKENIKIDKELIRNDLLNKNKKKEFLLSEILFNLDKNEKLNDKIILLEREIKNNGFSKTALSYSNSDTANKGGKLGWVNETILNTKIKEKVKKTKVGNFTKPIVIPGGFLILKIEDVREVENISDLNLEINKIVKIKTNEQLNQFSNIYFNKVKKNTTINETVFF